MHINKSHLLNTANVVAAQDSTALYGPSTAADLGGGIFTVPDGACGDIDIRIAGLTSETFGLTMTPDGTNYSAALLPIDVATGLPVAAATLGDGHYLLPVKIFGSPCKIKFTKSATTESAAVSVAVPSLNKNV